MTARTTDSATPPIVVAALYRFFHLQGPAEVRASLLNFCIEQKLKGTVLLAGEGINGTVAGTKQGIAALRRYFDELGWLDGMEYKESVAESMPFHRMKVKLKKEIVTIGLTDIDPSRQTGEHLNAEEWNRVISDPDTLVLDTRNDYEFAIGTFQNARPVGTTTFREFPGFVQQQLDRDKHKKIAMFCTGGIRCEKASAYLLQQGFEKVYQLNGGILRYLEEVPAEQNLWQGECFVFDSRVAVDEALNPGSHNQCFACRRPISEKDMASDKYVKGVSCPYCFDELSSEQKQRFQERQKQVEVAEARGEQHIGIASPNHKLL